MVRPPPLACVGHFRFCERNGAGWQAFTAGGARFRGIFDAAEPRAPPLLPSVPPCCPYTAKPGSDGECPGLAEARATNPLTFSLASIDWLYERRAVTQRCVGPDSVPVPQQLSFVNRRAVTQRLRETQRLMTLSTPLLTVPSPLAGTAVPPSQESRDAPGE